MFGRKMMFRRKKAVDDEVMGQAKALGIFSYVLGISQILRPGSVNRMMGVPDHAPNHELQRILGAREIMSGTGILFGEKKRRWMWSRVIGDVMDIWIIAGTAGAGLGTRKKLIATIVLLTSILIWDTRVALKMRED